MLHEKAIIGRDFRDTRYLAFDPALVAVRSYCMKLEVLSGLSLGHASVCVVRSLQWEVAGEKVVPTCYQPIDLERSDLKCLFCVFPTYAPSRLFARLCGLCTRLESKVMEGFKATEGSSPWNVPSGYAVITIIVSCFLSYITYQIFLHPLANIPGPKLAAISTLFEGYIDVSTQGRYLWKIEEWHQKRIGPNEVHVNDVSYYEELYNGKLRLDKFEYYYKLMIFPHTTFGTLSAQVHQTRREALDPFFNPGAVEKIQPLLQQLVDRLCERMSENIAAHKPIPLFYAYRSLTVDLISEYAFGERLDMLERADWGRSFYRAFRCVMEVTPLMRQIPFLLGVFMIMPRWMIGMIDRRMLEIIDLNSSIDVSTARTLKLNPQAVRAKAHPTVVWQLANSSTLPAQEKTLERIALEANSIVTGGMEAASATLTYTTFQILNNPDVHARLNMELREAIPDPSSIPHYSDLQKLPYLTACIKEGLRYVGWYTNA
nr:cytodhrome p450 monooxygenase [Quercus suber]